MALYEIVLRFRDHDEVRLTDHDEYRVGDEIVVAGHRFLVSRREPLVDKGSADRFILELCDEKPR